MLNINNIKKYILVLPNNEDRLNNVNFIKNNIFPDIEIKYVINSPYDDIGYTSIKDQYIKTNFWDNKILHYKNVREYSCALEHYRIIKEAYLLNYDYIFICEDDVRPIEPIHIINKFLENCPENFDLLKIGYWDKDIKTNNKEDWIKKLYYDENIYWIESNKVHRYGTQASIYSKNGMEKYLDFQNKYLLESDLWSYELNNDLKYISTIPLFEEINIPSIIQH